MVGMLILSCCSYQPNHPDYQKQYSHLTLKSRLPKKKFQETDYFLVMLVNARHLDYSNNNCLLKTLAKHPSDGSKNGDVGHAWIYVQGIQNGRGVYLEGGLSGELGISQPKYFEGIVDSAERGDPNPIQYLWAYQKDGFFQKGSGNHKPTFAAKIDLTPRQFQQILEFITNYEFRNYSLVGNQCSSFVRQVAAIANFPLEDRLKIAFDRRISLKSTFIPLWKDPFFSSIEISSPDILEKSLITAVQEGRAEYALNWYRKSHQQLYRFNLTRSLSEISNFPHRFNRYLLFQSL